MLYANLLSISRVPLAALIWVAPANPFYVFAIMGVAGVTDVLDGWVVRRARRHLEEAGHPGADAAWASRGAALDGFADKVFVVSVVLALAFAVGPPLWQIALLAAREILFVPIVIVYRLLSAERRKKVDFTSEVPGKAATIAQFVALVLGFVRHPFFAESAIGAGVLGLLAVLYYVVRAVRAASEEQAT